ncbi:MAG: DedA family protein [Gammaproteobacteria bacterium]|nr:DedA family protein [Gammaproteobacteria bacterium]
MDLLASLLDIAMHLDVHLQALVAEYHTGIYAILFLIVFIETGLVVWPFLPGDSLLFVSGTLAAAGEMDIATLMIVLIAAALTGDNVNYGVGRLVGPKVFHYERSRWFNPAHLARAHDFYERHGGKTIILARFIPIIRTYAPFVAGIGAMPYLRYLGYCVVAAVLWVVSLSLAGFFFGNIPWVRQNLSIVIVLIVLLSISPGIFAWAGSRWHRG